MSFAAEIRRQHGQRTHTRQRCKIDAVSVPLQYTYDPSFLCLDVANIWVQSLDGELYRLCNGMVEVSGNWSEHLIAGPLVYLPKENALVTSTSTFTLICYACSPKTAHRSTRSLIGWVLLFDEIVFCRAASFILPRAHVGTPDGRNRVVCRARVSLYSSRQR